MVKISHLPIDIFIKMQLNREATTTYASNVENVEAKMRPRTLDEMIGQESIKKILSREVANAISSNSILPNMILSGPAGTGKTTTALSLAAMMPNTTLKAYNGSKDLNARKVTQELMGLDIRGYTPDGKRGPEGKNVLVFVDEAHKLGDFEVWLHPMEDMEIMVDGAINWLPYTTFLFSTNFPNILPEALRSRCPLQLRFDTYTLDEIRAIVHLNYPDLKANLVDEVAVRSRLNPRTAISYARSVKINGLGFFQIAGISDRGLLPIETRYIEALANANRPLSLSTLSNILHEPGRVLADLYEPFLIQQGYIGIESRGRYLIGTYSNKPRGQRQQR